MNELLYAGILICLWALYKFDVVRRGKESLRDIVDIKKEIEKHYLKKRDELRNQVDTLVTACAKLEGEVLKMESEVALVEIEKTHLNDKINGLKSLISRMKNDRDRRENILGCPRFTNTGFGDEVSMNLYADTGEEIIFYAGFSDKELTCARFEKLTGLKVRKGGE